VGVLTALITVNACSYVIGICITTILAPTVSPARTLVVQMDVFAPQTVTLVMITTVTVVQTSN